MLLLLLHKQGDNPQLQEEILRLLCRVCVAGDVDTLIMVNKLTAFASNKREGAQVTATSHELCLRAIASILKTGMSD